MPPAKRLPPSGGFTVTEILVALAVLSALALLLLPALPRVLGSAHEARCHSNLRALWSSMAAYRADHQDRYIPYSDGEVIWTAGLMDGQYLDDQTDLLFCPAFPKETDLKTPQAVARITGGLGRDKRGTYSHYGYNHMHVGGSSRYGGDARVPAQGTQIATPSRTILLVESRRNVGSATPRGSFIAVDRTGSEHTPDPRHQGRVNTLFADGHTEAIRLADPANPWLPAPGGLGMTTQAGSLWKRQ